MVHNGSTPHLRHTDEKVKDSSCWCSTRRIECQALCLKRAHPKRPEVTPSRCQEPGFGANATGRRISDPGKTTRPLTILQWNAEGVYNKKVPLTERLRKDSIDVPCIQEITPQLRHPEVTRPPGWAGKENIGEVLILVRNSIGVLGFKVDTNQQAKIHGVSITTDNSAITTSKLYCPPTPHPPPTPPPHLPHAP